MWARLCGSSSSSRQTPAKTRRKSRRKSSQSQKVLGGSLAACLAGPAMLLLTHYVGQERRCQVSPCATLMGRRTCSFHKSKRACARSARLFFHDELGGRQEP